VKCVGLPGANTLAHLLKFLNYSRKKVLKTVGPS
jgi:hypothetical protein